MMTITELTTIATENFETVETLDNDFTLGSLRDIHEVTVDEIKAALEAAFEAGRESAGAGKDSGAC